MGGEGGERFFRELAEHSDAVLWMYTADFSELLFVNSAYERIFGRPIDDLYDDPMDFMEAVHPADRDRVRSAVERVAGGEPVDLEFRVNEAEDYGRRVWVEGKPIPDDEGGDDRVLGVARDVTERRGHEAELERYATIVEATGDPVYTLDTDGRFTFVNEALVELSGYDEAALLGEHASVVLADDDVERGEELIQSLLDGEAERGTYELALRTTGGRTIPCENHVGLLRGRDGGFRGTVGVLRDISARRRRQHELERQVDRFEAIFETVPEPLVHVRFEDDRPIVQRVNPAFTEVFGYTTEELEGRSVNEVIVPESRLDDAREIDEQAKIGETVEREVRRKAVDGIRDFRFRVNWFKVTGEHREAIGTYVDMTEEKRRQRELERQNERLEEFASVVSHDLRNPLNVIQGRTQLARDTGEAKHFDAIERSTERMASLIDDLLSLARAGGTVQSFEPVELGSVVKGCWRNVETGEATIEVVDDATVYADESRLQQLFENLFGNAVRHGGPAVTVRVGTLDGGFYVEDDGPGVPAEDRETVFESGYTTEEEGTGYGLRIVRTIVEAHGWDVTLTAGEDGGARFEVTGVRFA